LEGTLDLLPGLFGNDRPRGNRETQNQIGANRMSTPQIQYLLEQIDQRHRELKSELRSEFKDLREEIKSDNTEIHKRLTMVERFKWHITGALAILVIISEAFLYRWFEK
jgi:DNA polymerase sigma